jgi:hypothetical protein
MFKTAAIVCIKHNPHYVLHFYTDQNPTIDRLQKLQQNARIYLYVSIIKADTFTVQPKSLDKIREICYYVNTIEEGQTFMK